jgi:chromosome segregation protein
LGENLKKIRREAENNTERIENCRKSVAEKNQQIHKINQDNRKKQENRLELKDKLRREQFEIEKADKYKQHLRLERESLDRSLREALEDIGNNFNGEIDDLRKIFSNKTLDDLKMEIEKLNWQLEQVKEIDNSVVEEAGELEEKYDFLKKESEDLKLTLTELKEMVVEMDKNIKVKMKKAFKAINKEFSDYFKLMFGGGTAKLERTKFEKRRIASSEGDLENEDKKEFEYGLEIKVNPPGKRIDSLNMLSGGERTLTSIALLFALISHNPPPFVFLDEIEANLDESNAGKFSRILKKLSSKTQFILATHSREVMRVADILYGITMNKKDGYSNIFSVSLTQIEKDVKINS